MEQLLNAIKAEDVQALEQAYNQCDHNSVQIEGACVLTLTPEAEPPQFSGAYAETETHEFRNDKDPIVIGPDEASGNICRFLSKNMVNPDNFARSHMAAQMFGHGGEVEGMYSIEEWNVDEHGKHTSLKSCRCVITKLENENLDPNRTYKRVILAVNGIEGGCRI
jgi:hypothetical protein